MFCHASLHQEKPEQACLCKAHRLVLPVEANITDVSAEFTSHRLPTHRVGRPAQTSQGAVPAVSCRAWNFCCAAAVRSLWKGLSTAKHTLQCRATRFAI